MTRRAPHRRACDERSEPGVLAGSGLALSLVGRETAGEDEVSGEGLEARDCGVDGSLDIATEKAIEGTSQRGRELGVDVILCAEKAGEFVHSDGAPSLSDPD